MDGNVYSSSEEAVYSSARELKVCIDDLSGEMKQRITWAMYIITILLVMTIFRAFGFDAQPLFAASVVVMTTILTDIRLKQLVNKLDQYRALIGDIESHPDSQSLTAVWSYTTNAKKYVMMSLWSFAMCGIDIVGIAAISAALLIH